MTTVRPLSVKPVAGVAVNAVAPVKPIPVKVTERFAGRTDTFGETELSVGASTWKVTKLLTPPGVVMVTFLAPRGAVEAMVKVVSTSFALIWLIGPTVIPVAGLTVIAVAPFSKLPVSFTATTVLRTPLAGEMAFSVGAEGATTVKGSVLLVPATEVTETVRFPSVAVDAIVKVAWTVVSFSALTLLTVTPVPETVTAETPVKPLPYRVTFTMVPSAPCVGTMKLRVGVSTVNGSGLVSPLGVVTVTFRAPMAAVAAIAKFALRVVSFTTVNPLAVTPVPDTVTAVAPVKPMPYRVTATVLLRTP